MLLLENNQNILQNTRKLKRNVHKNLLKTFLLHFSEKQN